MLKSGADVFSGFKQGQANMADQPKMTKQQAIDELRAEARAIENAPCHFKQYASKAHKVKIRRDLADKLGRELQEELKNQL